MQNIVRGVALLPKMKNTLTKGAPHPRKSQLHILRNGNIEKANEVAFR